MKTHLVLFLFLLSVLEAKTLKIASYNVENLFDMQYSGLEYKEYIPGRHQWTAPILVKKLQHTAEVICDLDADVIALQEIENDRILERLQRVLKRVGCRYGYRAITDTKRTAIHTALLSKIPLKKHRDVVISRHGRHRSILEVDLKLEPSLKLFVNHWKSKAGPESGRIVYAKALKHRIDALPKGKAYVILGDFNEDYREYQTIKPKHNDTGGRTGINHVLKTIRGQELVRLHAFEEGYHYNLWLELPRYARWSHNFFGDKEGIDAIIIPASLHDGRGWEYQEGSFGVFKPKYLFGRRGRIKRWEYSHSKHRGKGYSDHLPVYASLVLGKEGVRIDKGGIWGKVLSLFSFDAPTAAPPQQIVQQHVVSQAPEAVSIGTVITREKITVPVRLTDVKVIWKHRDSAIIKQSAEGRAILLYRCAEALKAGKRYTLTVYQKKRYKGLDELTDIRVEQTLGTVDVSAYLRAFSPALMQEKRFVNEVVSGIEGRYHKHKIILHGTACPLYFKKGLTRPKEGQKIRILRAQIGYYKNHNELVIWNPEDYQILE